jgi:hypothetical protein
MAFSTNSVVEIFPSATVANGNLTIPSGAINSYVPTSLTSPTVYEMVYGIIDTMADAVATGNLANVTVTQSQTLTGTTLSKRYNFVVNLDMSGNTVDAILNVKSEPS